MSSSLNTIEFVSSVAVAGVLGPAVGYAANRWADYRRFAHERGLKASDDLIERIDEVAASFENLRDACARLRVLRLLIKTEDAQVLQQLQAAEQVHIDTCALISRLALRPHADEELIESAKEGAAHMYAAIGNVRNASIARNEVVQAASQGVVVGHFDDEFFESEVDQAQQHMTAFETQARAAVSKLLSAGGGRSRKGLFLRR